MTKRIVRVILWSGVAVSGVMFGVVLNLSACNSSDASPNPIAKATAEAMAAATKKPAPAKPDVDRFIEATIKRIDPRAKCEEWDGPETRYCEMSSGAQQLWCKAGKGEKPRCEVSFDFSPFMQPKATTTKQPAGKK